MATSTRTDLELGLCVLFLKNMTIVVLHWIHLALNATTKKAVLDAWRLTRQGREDEILEPLAPEKYILENVGINAAQPHALASKPVYTGGAARPTCLSPSCLRLR